MIELSIIIVTYKSAGVIVRCLDSIKAYNDIGDSLEVIIVDNSPEDDDTSKLIDEDYPWVRLYRNPQNGGFGQANNIGADVAQGTSLLFLNPDTALVEPIFKFAVKTFKKTPNMKAFGMMLIDVHGRHMNSFGIMPECKGVIPAKLYIPFIRMTGGCPRDIYPWGADLFVRRKEFLNVGGFDENLFMCYEEPDLMRRLGDGEVKIFSKRIIHDEGHTTDYPQKRLEIALESERKYFDKHGLDYRAFAKKARRACRLKCILARMRGDVQSYALNKLMIEHYERYLATVMQ